MRYAKEIGIAGRTVKTPVRSSDALPRFPKQTNQVQRPEGTWKEALCLLRTVARAATDVAAAEAAVVAVTAAGAVRLAKCQARPEVQTQVPDMSQARHVPPKRLRARQYRPIGQHQELGARKGTEVPGGWCRRA